METQATRGGVLMQMPDTSGGSLFPVHGMVTTRMLLPPPQKKRKQPSEFRCWCGVIPAFDSRVSAVQ